MTLAEFSRQTGIPEGTLSSWRHTERRRAAEKSRSAARLVPVEVIDIAQSDLASETRGKAPVGAARRGEPAVVVELAAGHRISLSATLSPEVMAQLIAKVVTC
jgi:hypothetical protein